MAGVGSMRGEERFRRQSQRDLSQGPDRCGGWGGDGDDWTTFSGDTEAHKLLCEHMHAQCLQVVDEQGTWRPLHVIDLVSSPVTVVPKVQYFCSNFTSRPLSFCKFQVHTCLHDRVITTRLVSSHHHTVDPLCPFCLTSNAFLIV